MVNKASTSARDGPKSILGFRIQGLHRNPTDFDDKFAGPQNNFARGFRTLNANPSGCFGVVFGRPRYVGGM